MCEPCCHEHSGYTREHGGTGLSSSRQLARLVDGELTVTTGAGSCFVLELAAAAESPAIASG